MTTMRYSFKILLTSSWSNLCAGRWGRPRWRSAAAAVVGVVAAAVGAAAGFRGGGEARRWRRAVWRGLRRGGFRELRPRAAAGLRRHGCHRELRGGCPRRQ
jgi:hypothetical protein